MTMLVFLHALLVFLHVLLVFIYSVGFGLNCTGGVLDFRGALLELLTLWRNELDKFPKLNEGGAKRSTWLEFDAL